jgi:hypothetical protein
LRFIWSNDRAHARTSAATTVLPVCYFHAGIVHRKSASETHN